MKLEANVKLNVSIDGYTEGSIIAINVDADYVSAYEDEIREWIANELAKKFGHSFGDDEFEILNLEDLMDDLLESTSL